MILVRLLVLVLLGVSCQSWGSNVDMSLQQQQDIERQVPARAYSMMGTDNDQRFPVLIQGHTSAANRGVAVLVNDIAETPLEHSSLAPLVHHLNRIGWDTLLLSPPVTDLFVRPQTVEPDIPSPSEQTEGNEGQEENATDEPPKPYEVANPINPEAMKQHKERLIARMQAVEQERQTYRGYYLVVAKGTSAAWLLELYNNNQLPLPDALVTVAPYWPDTQKNQTIAELIGQNKLPLLDIVTSWENSWASVTVDQRRQAALKAFQPDYRQRQLVGQQLSPSQSAYLSKEIYGWLSSMGW